MVAHQGGKDLFYSTHKVCCPERDSCPSFARSCEASSGTGDIVNHMIFSSEELSGENVWQAMEPGQIIGVDRKMRLFDSHGVVPLTRAPAPSPSRSA
jgi:glutamine amidotransferase